MTLRVSGESEEQPRRLRCPSRGRYLWNTLTRPLLSWRLGERKGRGRGRRDQGEGGREGGRVIVAL